MDSFTLTTFSSRLNPFHLPTKKTNPSSSISRPTFVVFASKDESKLENWELMELKFGRMIGEDPKLTLAKIAGRKANPDVSYLEIEKQFNKKNFEVDEFIEEFQERPPNSLKLSRPVPKKGTKFEEDETQPSNSLNLARPVPKRGTKFEEDHTRPSSNSLNLARPVLKKGTKFEESERPTSSPLNLVRPVTNKGNKFGEDANADKSFESWKKKATVSSSVEDEVDGRTRESSIPSVILRKPSAAYPEDDIEVKKSSRLTIKPNLTLKMSKGETKENFSDITLLKKPEPARPVIESDPVDTNSGDSIVSSSGSSSEASKDSYERPETRDDSFVQVSWIEDKPTVGVQPLEQSNLEPDGKKASIAQPDVELQRKPPRLDQSSKDESEPAKGKADFLTTPKSENFISAEALHSDLELDGTETQPEIELQRKPRLDQSTKDEPKPVQEKVAPVSIGHAEIQNFISAEPLQEPEDADWSRAEYLCDTGGREEVELISCSIRGFVASFGSLIGFLPYRNLGAKWKFLAFESWLRKKGLDPSMYRQNLGIVGVYESLGKNLTTDANLDKAIVEGKLSQDMKLEDLLEIYDQEKIKFLSSFVGLRLKVNVVLADRNSRKLMFSGKPKEKDELVQKKRNLMAKLNIGDVVKCCIKKITYFGIFVEVEGVPALIHQSEVSWDVTLDPSLVFKIGQIVEAKVHQLDFGLDRITLSLKEITPDPLTEALESVVGDRKYLEGSLEAAQPDIEWADVESLIRELEKIEGIQSVLKGRFFLSPGLAPTFQVYMASMFQNQYKLLARSENKVQEVIVRASLDKEAMKAAILACTNRVE